MSPEVFVQLVTTGGPSAVLALWLWSERKEKLRLQRLVESFLPLAESNHRLVKQVSRVVGVEEEG